MPMAAKPSSAATGCGHSPPGSTPRGELPIGGGDVETVAGVVRLDRAEALDGRPAWSAVLPGLELGEGNAERREIRLGNPHRVLKATTPPDAAALDSKRAEERNVDQVNLGLAFPVSRHRIVLRVHERGAGPTPACGSGACAAAVAMIEGGQVDAPVRVEQPGGSVVVDWRRGESRVRLTGPARVVFEGSIPWPNPTPQT
jgi:diaminopimelate epimerase